ncbi:MAG TPA: hypothetical protein VMT22_22490, partial [Terriglobales bacterium]|nr:hypothetical protein [Terriglobales bacterium]
VRILQSRQPGKNDTAAARLFSCPKPASIDSSASQTQLPTFGEHQLVEQHFGKIGKAYVVGLILQNAPPRDAVDLFREWAWTPAHFGRVSWCQKVSLLN